MNKIKAIALNTFKETIRDRILYLILFIAAIFLLTGVVLGTISLEQDAKIIQDFGLFAIFIFGAITTLFLGAVLIDKEIEKKTVYLIFPKPISKSEFVLGKFFGQALTVLIAILILSAAFFTLLFWKTHGFDAHLLIAIFLIYLELLLLSGLALMFSALSRPLNALVYSLLLLFVGHSMDLILDLANKTTNFFNQYLLKIIYYLLPNLNKFDLREVVVAGGVASLNQVIVVVFYFLVYTSFLLFLAVFIIRKREY